MTRDNLKPITDEPFSASGMFTLSPNATTVRYPADPTEFFNDVTAVNGIVDEFYIRNKSAAQIRVVIDGDAGLAVGEIIDAGEDYRLPHRAYRYISLYGGDGTAVRVHWYRY